MKRTTFVCVAMLAILSLVACGRPREASASEPVRDEQPAAPSVPIAVIDTPLVIAPPTPTMDDLDLETGEGFDPAAQDDDAIDAHGARVIHPHGGMPDCLEMYSACSPDPDHPGQTRCTSAPLMLACGQRGTIPGGETLLCVCP